MRPWRRLRARPCDAVGPALPLVRCPGGDRGLRGAVQPGRDARRPRAGVRALQLLARRAVRTEAPTAPQPARGKRASPGGYFPGKSAPPDQLSGIILMTSEGRERRLPAIHQADIEDVLGSPVPARWHCVRCGSEQTGLPAAFVKEQEGLRFLCFSCLLTADDPVNFPSSSGIAPPRHP